MTKKTISKLFWILALILFFFSVLINIFFFIFIHRFRISEDRFYLQNSEIGHCLSIFFDLNDYDFRFFDNDESKWNVYWNDEIIFSEGKLNRKNIKSVRYQYGDNTVLIKNGEIQKKFYFYKYNNWSFYKFKIVAGKDNVNFYIDENEAEICIY